jgi:uroporphyrinogen decarboxylase
MTPRERLRAALRFEPYDGPVPHLELEFQLAEELFGERNLRHGDYEALPAYRRRDELARNARLWIRIAERFDHSVINGTHWLPLEAQAESFQIIRELSGDRFMLSAFQDGTQAIPSGADLASLSFRIADDPEGLLSDLDARCDAAIRNICYLVEAGAEIVFMCADYCFNQGPFLSARMFRRFVTPFINRQTAAIRAAGAFAVQHTDGNLWPIFDQLIESRPHALHSIDPMAGMDIRLVRQRVGRDICLMGNVNCALLQSGTPAEIIASARYCLEHGPVEGTGYVFSSSNCIFEGVPSASYLTMLAVRDAWYRERGGTSAGA